MDLITYVESLKTFLGLEGVKELTLTVYLMSTAICLFILVIMVHTRLVKMSYKAERRLIMGSIIYTITINFIVYLIH